MYALCFSKVWQSEWRTWIAAYRAQCGQQEIVKQQGAHNQELEHLPHFESIFHVTRKLVRDTNAAFQAIDLVLVVEGRRLESL